MWRYAYPEDDDHDDDKTHLTWSLARRVLGYARPYRIQIVIVLVLILIQTGVGLLNPLIFRDLIDYTLPNQDSARLNLLAVGLVVLPLINNALGTIIRRLNSTIGEGVIYDLRSRLFEHMQGMSLRFFTHTSTGELMSRLNNDVVNAQTAISDTIVGTITNALHVIAALIVMVTLDWRLTLLGLVVFPVTVVAARRLGVQLRRIARESMDLNAQMNAMMNETLNISGTLLVKLFGRKRLEVGRFNERAARVRDIGVTRAVMERRFWNLVGLVWIVGTALVFWGGGHLVLQGVFTIGTIVAFSSYLGQIYDPLQYLTQAPTEFARSSVSFERVFEVIDLPLEIDEKPNAQALNRVRGELAFEGVSFRYGTSTGGFLSTVHRYGDVSQVRAVLSGEDSTEPDAASGNGTDGAADGTEGVEREAHSQAREVALEDISFHLHPGQLAALVGPSGAGKTTLTYLIPRLYDPTEGRILLDGHDLREVTLESLAANIGMVTQETFLFHDTIRMNLLYARLKATQSELEAACKAANIHDFIMDMPQGYDTIVGERGYRLSGGEKQRLAIARVILKDPRILVLDEATSHLDSQSEVLIQDALEKIMADRTSIVIAHRLSTILAADLILVMDRGRIVERGTHADLRAAGGLYAQLYDTQFSRLPA